MGKEIVVYTDGSVIGNPGPGGYGVIIEENSIARRLSRGFRLTTNNRMELFACIAALQSLDEGSKVVIYTDSRYVVDGFGRAGKWRMNNWVRQKGSVPRNSDLWARLLELCDSREVDFRWIKGHSGNPGNEESDFLAIEAARGKDLDIDEGYEEAIEVDS